MIDNLETYPTPTELKLNDWNKFWKLSEFTIHCRSCGESQRAKHATQAFPHTPNCQSKKPHFEYPWHDLRRLLRNLPTPRM